MRTFADAIDVATRARGKAGVKVVRDFLRAHDRDVVGQTTIECQRKTRRRSIRLVLKTRDVSERVDAGVGARAPDRVGRVPAHDLDRRLECALHGASAPGCFCHPWKSVPSYSRSKRILGMSINSR